MIIICHEGKLVYCNWDDPDCDHKLKAIERKLNEACGSGSLEEDRLAMEKAEKQLEEYFRNERTDFDLPVEFIGSEFQKKVWTLLTDIKYGETVTYKTLAERCGNPGSVRAVAKACGSNPVAVIAGCHRVVASNGKLGGYTGGTDKKIWLLNHEIQKIFAGMKKTL